MNFAEAMNLVAANPAGNDAVAVKRSAMNGFVFYDATLFLGEVPFGFRFAREVNGDSFPYTFSVEDLNATDWQVMAW